ncbi:MAG: virulence factor Mce family protein [Marmoricola sp.]|jgi:phospholipid/cholesterol/gamma-HCH transport system substrate-binding protein|nr:virulence factor Mce family protein [Marmoricola sp.]
MTRGVKIRLMAFVILSAVGIVYVAGSFLGIVDHILGRGYTIHATLPGSGGLFTGSEVTYRGVKIGKVSRVDVIPSGIRVDLAIKDKVKIPKDSTIHVHNLSAVGEQYLDFEPVANQGPYAEAGYTIKGNAASLPMSEEQLLTELDAMVNSVDKTQLTTVISELGYMFHDTADPLRRMVDSGTQFVDAAAANKDDTIALLETGRTVLQTQANHEKDITTFAKGLADLTGSLKASDKDLRTILQGGPPAVREVDSLLKGLEPTLPVFLSNLVTVNQVLTNNIPGLEQTLVTFPRVIASGFTGTPGDGYGHINLQLNNSVGPCTKGYLPNADWRPATDLSDKPFYPARCLEGAPKNMRGTKYAPGSDSVSSLGRSNRVSPYDAKTGVVDAGDGTSLTLGTQGGLRTVFGDDSWKWMLTGPVTESE